MLHRVNIHQAPGLGTRLLDNLPGPVHRTQVNHPLPVFTGTRADRLVIAGHRIPEKVLLAAMFREPVQADGDVAYLPRLQAGSHEAHVQQDITVNAACKVADALLDAVVIIIGTDGGIVPGLRYEVHCGCKGTTFPQDFCVLQNRFTSSKPRKQGLSDHFIPSNNTENHEKLFRGVKVGLGKITDYQFFASAVNSGWQQAIDAFNQTFDKKINSNT